MQSLRHVSTTLNEPHSFAYDEIFGVVATDLNWVPSIRYLLRRNRILEIVSRLPIGKLLEIGCGSGALLVDFLMVGFTPTGIETSPRALELAYNITQKKGPSIKLYDQLDAVASEHFDLVCAFDVLEHIEDDCSSIVEWSQLLSPGGKLLISVPAHPSRWSPGDVWAGHFRRYDRNSLITLLVKRGFIIEHMECYGFPLANLTEWVGKRTYRHLLTKRNHVDLNKATATAASGINRTWYLRYFKVVRTPFGKALLHLCFFVQRLFIGTDLGSGFIVLATRT